MSPTSQSRKSNMLIVKDNALINASYNLELVEQRLILLATIEARESGKGINANDALTIHASSYMHHFNVEKHTAYKNLRDACKTLFTRQFSYSEISENGAITHYTSRWVSKVGYTPSEATIKLVFAPDVVPLITRLEEHFTSYEIEQVSKLSSKYSTRLYEMLIGWRTLGKTHIFEIEDFRKKMGIEENEYSLISNLKSRVLEPSIKQINEHTDIVVTYEQHKKGRVISGFSFKFKQKIQKKIEKNRDQNTADLFTKMTDAQRHLFANKLAHDVRVESNYSHLVGTGSHEQFAKILADMLTEEEHFKVFLPLLIEHGYNG